MSVYVDTSAFLAVLDADDENHEAAKKNGPICWSPARPLSATVTYWWRPMLWCSTG